MKYRAQPAETREERGSTTSKKGIFWGGSLLLFLVFLSCAKPPVIDSITANPNPVAPYKQTLLTAVAYSPKGYVLSYHWSLAEEGGGELLQKTGNPVFYVAPKLTGSYIVVLKVLDSHGQSASDSVLINVEQPCRRDGIADN